MQEPGFMRGTCGGQVRFSLWGKARENWQLRERVNFGFGHTHESHSRASVIHSPYYHKVAHYLVLLL